MHRLVCLCQISRRITVMYQLYRKGRLYHFINLYGICMVVSLYTNLYVYYIFTHIGQLVSTKQGIQGVLNSPCFQKVYSFNGMEFLRSKKIPVLPIFSISSLKRSSKPETFSLSTGRGKKIGNRWHFFQNKNFCCCCVSRAFCVWCKRKKNLSYSVWFLKKQKICTECIDKL